MIGKLKGRIDEVCGDYLILDVNGVGYQVYCSLGVLHRANSAISSELVLFIETVVKEDSITLFGFESMAEKECFQTLCKVSGVGSRVAIKIMSTLNIEEISSAIVNQDKNTFCRVQGVGPKLAAKIVLELENSIFVKGFAAMAGLTSISAPSPIASRHALFTDTIAALENLGYQKSMVLPIVNAVLEERDDLTLESAITRALQKINSR